MKRVLVVSLIIFSFIIFLISWSFIESSLSRSVQLKFLNSTNSNYTCLYYGKGNFNDDFYYMNKSLGLKFKDEKIVVDVLMYKKDKVYTIDSFNNYKLIKSNEMIISRNVASKYDLKIGDTVKVSSSLYDNLFEYRVKEVIEPIFCFTEEYFVEDKGIVVLGNSSSLIEINNMSVAFVGDKESLNEVSLEKVTSIDRYKHSLLQDIFIDCSIIEGFLFLMLVAYFVLFEIIYSFRIRKAIINGALTNSIIKRYYLNPIILSIIYSFMIIVFVLIDGLILFNMLIIPLPLIMILIIPIISYVISIVLLKIKLRRI